MDTDKSILNFDVINFHQQQFINGQSMQLKISLSHFLSQPDRSHSNAHDIDIFLYYDTGFVTFQSITFNEKDQFSLSPSSNTTKLGLIHFHTDTLWLLNNQHLSIHFKINTPNTILKGDKCKGTFLLDFKYLNNLQQFNGRISTTKSKVISYQCKIDQWKDTSLKSVRLDLPQLSMLYDNVNGEFIFCIQRVSFATRNGPFCYRQKQESDEWYGISEIAVVLGMENTTRILYGIDITGKVYLQASFPFSQFYQIEDSYWKSKESTSVMQKAITVNDVSALPLSATPEYAISVSGMQLWAATKFGILKRRDGILKRVIVL